MEYPDSVSDEKNTALFPIQTLTHDESKIFIYNGDVLTCLTQRSHGLCTVPITVAQQSLACCAVRYTTPSCDRNADAIVCCRTNPSAPTKTNTNNNKNTARK